MKKRIYEILNELGISCNLKGRKYLERAIELVLEYGEVPLHKVLYPNIALTFNTTCSRIERAIRHAIERSFLNVDLVTLKKYFGNSMSYKSGKSM